MLIFILRIYAHNLLILKRKTIFNELFNKRLNEIDRLSNEIDFNDLEYTYIKRMVIPLGLMIILLVHRFFIIK